MTRRRDRTPETLFKTFDEDGAWAAFWLRVDGAHVGAVDYRCTTCATLMSACEAVCAAADGMEVSRALTISAEWILAETEGVPEMRRHRFRLAAQAFHEALAAAAALKPAA